MVSVDRIKGLSSGLAIKAPCRVATTTNITLSGLPVVDTVQLASGDAVLVGHQDDPVDNGVWVASPASWPRRSDADKSNDLVNGTLFTVTEGTQSGQIFQLVATNPVLPGTTPLAFIPKVPLNLDASTGASLIGATDGAGGTLWTTVQGFIAKILSSAGASIVGFIQSGTGSVPRTMQDKAREIVSVKDFGAVGDGITDDTAAFAAALAASAYEVYVPHGTYIISGLTVDGKLLQGPGTIKWKAGAASSCIELTGSKPSLRGLLLDGNAAAQTNNLVMITTNAAVGADIYGCRATNGRYRFFQTDAGGSPGARIEANAFYEWGTSPSCNVIDLRSSYGLVSGNSFRGIGDGHCVRIGKYGTDPTTPVVGCVVSANTFTDTEHVGVCLELYAQGVVISGNSFVGLEQGVKIETAGYTAFDITITGNYFANLTLVTAFNLTGAQVTFIGNVCVDCAGGVDLGPRSVCSSNIIRNCGGLASSMPSIRASSAAVDCIISGNYVENAPYRGITLGPRAMCAYNRVINSNSYGVQIPSTDVTAVCNIVTGGTHGILLSSAGTNATITGNRVSGASTANYAIDGTARVTALLDITNIGYSPSAMVLALASDAITVPRENMVIIVDTEAGAATDTLSTINTTGGGYLGQIIVLRGNTLARVVTVSDSSNIRTAGNFVLNSTDDTLTLMWNGTYWLEVSRSDNA